MEIRDTKNIILRVAIDLFAQKGYSNVSIRELAKQAGIKSSSIYNHFSSKDDIMTMIMEHYQFKSLKFLVADTHPDEMEKLIKDKDFDEIMDEIFTPFPSDEVDMMRKMVRILMIEQFTHKKANEFWTEHIIVKAVNRLKNIFDLLIKYNKIPEINSLLASEICIRISTSYLIQFAHFQNGEETDTSLSMKTLLSYISELIRYGKI